MSVDLGVGEPILRHAHHPQVSAGAETVTGAGEHDRADIGVGGELGQGVLHPDHEAGAERVQPLRLVQRHRRPPVTPLHPNDLAVGRFAFLHELSIDAHVAPFASPIRWHRLRSELLESEF